MEKSIRLKYLKQYEDLTEPSITRDLIELNNILKNSDINGYKGTIGDIKYTIKINNNKPRYQSNIPTGEIIETIINDSKLDFILAIDVIDNFDKDYIISLIIHEIRHIYDIYTTTKQKHLNSFVRDLKYRLVKEKISDDRFSDFLNCIYYSLLHELVARNNQVYPLVKNKGLSKEESYTMIKTTFIYSSLRYLDNFNSDKFVNKFSNDEIIIFTDIFNNMYCKSNKKIKDINEYYHKWELFFKRIKERWFDEMYSEIDKIYENFGSTHEIIENECVEMLKWIIANFIL